MTQIDTSDIRVQMQVSRSHIASLLCSALEGQSNYWMNEMVRTLEPVAPLVKRALLEKEEEGATFWPLYDSPVGVGGSLTFVMQDGKRIILDLYTIRKGLEEMATHSPKEFGHAMADPSVYADLFLQYCLFGGEVYA